jgi:serine/threonine protein kinase
LTAGRFELEQVLGGGAFAYVAVARDRLDGGRRVALKVLRQAHIQNVTAVNRFRDEARILAQLDHPSIVRVFALLDYDGQPVMLMDYVAGASLDDLFLGRQPERLANTVPLEAARQVALALHDAYHGHYGEGGEPMRIIHRDVKPANIMIADTGRVKLLDFGVAKGDFSNRRARSLYNVAGSAGYDAPERRTRGVDTPGADVYALGVTLFVCLTTRPLLLPADPVLHAEGVDDAMPRLPEIEGVDRAGLIGLMRDMLGHAPDSRPSMQAVARRLAELLEPERLDMHRLVAPFVGAFVERRPVKDARESMAYPSVRFLEEVAPTPPPERLSAEEADIAIRSLLARKGWETRLPDLQRILDASPSLVQAPFLDLLRRADRRWWKVWHRPRRPTELEAALVMLLEQPGDDAKQLARALLSHPDRRVAEAAKYLLEQAG